MSLTPVPWRCRTLTPSPTTGKAQVGGGGGEPATPSIPCSFPLSHPSFRMRQVNIVGTSPPSQPSRKIQTLQAPPDIAPANVTLRTASETSLWLRWMVRLPRGQWDGAFTGLSPPCINLLTSKVTSQISTILYLWLRFGNAPVWFGFYFFFSSLLTCT